MHRVFIDRKTFQFGGSLGALLLLAMGDRGPIGGSMWAKHVTVVPYGSAMELRRLKLQVIESEPGSDGKTQLIEEEEMQLVHARQFDSRDSRCPSSRRHGIR